MLIYTLTLQNANRGNQDSKYFKKITEDLFVH